MVYVLFRYKLNTLTRLVAALLFCLALFQLAEYKICGTHGNAEAWARAGFVAITMLPPLGLHLALYIIKRGWLVLNTLAYITAAGFIYLFTFGQHTFSGHVCGGNYVIFQLDYVVSNFYYFYYYGWLLITIMLCLQFYYESKQASVRKALKWLVIGYLAFLVPTTVINSYSPATKAGVPSIMCGFAVLFALILAIGVLPPASKAKPVKKKS